MTFRLLGAASATSRDHYIVAPFAKTLTLSIASANLALSDGAGQRYTGDTLRIPIRVAADGSAAPTIIINVSHR